MVTQKSLISGPWASCYSKCVADGAHFTRKIPSRCTRTSVLARSGFPRGSSMMTGNNLSKGCVCVSFLGHLSSYLFLPVAS